jgi:hypothetical protein
MPRQPEGKIVAKIIKRIEERGGRAFKIQGSESSFQEIGIPDILACYQGAFLGLEVKQPGEKPSAAQRHVLREIEAAGGVAAVVTSVEEADTLLDGVIDRSVVAWIAGFFDGEGSIIRHRRAGMAHTRKPWRPRITITQKDPTPLLWIQEVLGMGRFKDYQGKLNSQGNTPACKLVISRTQDVTRFIQLVGPHIRLQHRRLKVEEVCDYLDIPYPKYHHAPN